MLARVIRCVYKRCEQDLFANDVNQAGHVGYLRTCLRASVIECLRVIYVMWLIWYYYVMLGHIVITDTYGR